MQVLQEWVKMEAGPHHYLQYPACTNTFISWLALQSQTTDQNSHFPRILQLRLSNEIMVQLHVCGPDRRIWKAQDADPEDEQS